MPKFACRIEYKGHAYSGWQFQDHSPSVQAAVEQALTKVADEPITTICAGRTDSGVHATGQIIHFETQAERSNYSWQMGTNANLPKDIAVRWIDQVDTGFHARFSAEARSYRYIIHNSQARSALFYKMVTSYYQQLNIEAMQEAAQHLLGEHDFSSYRATQCQAKSPIRNISTISLQKNGDFIYLDISANAFLHHMVRNIVGVLVAIGSGEEAPSWSKTVLDYRDRKKGGVTAPPDGLYLVRVQYPQDFNIPADHPLPQFS